MSRTLEVVTLGVVRMDRFVPKAQVSAPVRSIKMARRSRKVRRQQAFIKGAHQKKAEPEEQAEPEEVPTQKVPDEVEDQGTVEEPVGATSLPEEEEVEEKAAEEEEAEEEVAAEEEAEEEEEVEDAEHHQENLLGDDDDEEEDLDEGLLVRASKKRLREDDDEEEEEEEAGFGSDDDEEEDAYVDEEELPDEADEEDLKEAAAMEEFEEAEEAGEAAATSAAVVDIPSLKKRLEEVIRLLAAGKEAIRKQGCTSKELREELARLCANYYGYNEELAAYILDMFAPGEAVQLFEANDRPRPMTIRANTIKTRRRLLAQQLIARGCQVEPTGEWTKVGLTVKESTVPIGATPEYLSGRYMLQSASSFVPVQALNAQPGETVLDMSAAPGGKTTYIGQMMQNQGVLFANDLREDRCKALIANVHRLGLSNVVVTAMDGRKLKDMLPKLDRVLLDAPCSGSGIIARDPKIKVKRNVKEFTEHAALQRELLLTAIDMVDADTKTTGEGGVIVYSTCSMAVEEDEMVIDAILKARNVRVVPFDDVVSFGSEGFTSFRGKQFHPSLKHSRRFFPHVHNMDGFFVCKLQKFSNEIPQRVRKDRRPTEAVTHAWGEDKWKTEFMDTVMTDFPQEEGKLPPPEEKKVQPKISKKKRKLEKQQQQAEKAEEKVEPSKEKVEKPTSGKPATQKGKSFKKRKFQKKVGKAKASA
ncbi:hypothetical protein FOZ61_004025 [Perkinsus olseni]|uniref:SAM-dependent MTase RsmB/NOP-type domain-containing protein n=1 Tax=Perkinsus olseni TaxID=32597 RepID=A0A7J6LMB7_PEROL|nr:hypothetical protein FOZ61_004025 [Perkinsus olseni]